MPSLSESAERSDTPISLAVSHPMRSWVAALESLLLSRKDIEVVAAHTDVAWVRHAVVTGRANLLLLHLEPDQERRLRLLPEMFAANQSLKVVGLSESQDQTLLFAAIHAGVRGWVEPTTSVEHLVRVLHGVAAGETWFPPGLMTGVLDALLHARMKRQRASDVLGALSSREVQVLACLAKGLSRREIAERYVLSPHTVRTHINNVLRKLNVHSTLAAVSLARQVGLTDPDGIG